MSPRSAALPMSDMPSGPKYPGKIVMMSMRTSGLEQSGRRIDHEAARGHVHLGHDGGHERDEQLVAPAVGGRLDHEQILPVMQHVGHHAHRLADGRDGGEPDELIVM